MYENTRALITHKKFFIDKSFHEQNSSMLYVSTRPTGDPLVPQFPFCAPMPRDSHPEDGVCGVTTFIFDFRRARHYFVPLLSLPQLVGISFGVIDIVAPGTPDGGGQRGSDLGPPVTAEPKTRGASEQDGPLSSCVCVFVE